MHTHGSTVVRRNRLTVLLITLALLLATAIAASAGTVSNDANFEGDDGNLDNQGNTDWNDFAPVDWAGTAPYQTGTSTADGWALRALSDAAETNSDTGFAGGTKQDNFCAKTKGAKAPNKDDLERVYVAGKTIGTDVFVALSWARIPQNSTSASAHVAFEFNQGSAPCPGGSTLVEREPGDVLVVYDFEGGSVEPTLKLSRWLEASDPKWNTLACEISGGLPVGDGADGCWGDTLDITAAGFAEAEVNTTAPVTSQLPPGGAEVQDIGEFGEAIINMTDAGVFPAGECTALGNVFAVSRSSGNSGQAQMKDLVGPGDVNLSNCGKFTIEKELTEGETPMAGDDAVDFAFTVTPAAGDPSTSGFDLNIGDSRTVVNVQPGDYVVTETPIPSGWNLDDITCTDGGVEDVANAFATLTVTPDSDIVCTFENSRERGSIQVEKLLAATDTRVTGATFALDADGDSETTDDQTPIPAVAGEDGLFCIDDLLFGDYDVVETSPPDGYSGDASVEHVTVDGESTCADRASDDVDASFENKKIPSIETAATVTVTVGEDITDTATLSGGAAPTGTITFTAYSDDECTAEVFSDVVAVDGNDSYESGAYTTTATGTIYWIAAYSGDDSNEPAAGACGDPNESSVVEPATPDISTTASGPVTVGEDITDTATLSGGVDPTGTITFTAYSDDECTAEVFSDVVAVDGNDSYESGAYTTTAAGTIFWIAAYSGDDDNDAVSGECGDDGESSVVQPASPGISTTPKLLPNDSATLSGGYGDLVGTIDFELFASADCSGEAIYQELDVAVEGFGPHDTSNDSVYVTADGTYSWLVTYSGDGNNNPAFSNCNEEQQVIDFTPLGE